MAQTDYHYGTALLLRRKQLGITQEQLAEQTGISIRTISNAESGSESVSIGTVNLLRKTLGMTCLSVKMQKNGYNLQNNADLFGGTEK